MRSYLFLFFQTLLLAAGAIPGNAAKVESGQCTYSFFFFTYRQPFAAKAVYDRVRLFYPTAPMYILTDQGGIDLSYFCRNDSHCRSTVSTVKFGHAYKLVSEPLTDTVIYQMYTYFDYMAEGAEWGGCEFMLHLEEDVWYNRALSDVDRPVGDAGGGNNNKTYDKFTVPLQHYMIKESGNPNLGILLYIEGGSYFRSAPLIDCVRNHMRTLDWYTMHRLDNKITSAWDTVPAVLFHLSGYTTAYWPSVCSRPLVFERHYRRRCKSATILHKTPGNLARALYLVGKVNKSVISSVTAYEQLFALDLGVIDREALK